MPVETRQRIARVLESLDEGLITRTDVLVNIGLTLAESGSANDITSLPQWLRQELVNWAREFQQSRTWLLVSNAGEKDVSPAGRKLLALVEDAGLLT